MSAYFSRVHGNRVGRSNNKLVGGCRQDRVSAAMISGAARFFPCASFLLLAFVLCAVPVAMADGWPDLSSPRPTTAAHREDAAVVVGLEAYTFLPPVQGAVTSAQRWAAHLVQSRGVPRDRVFLLEDTRATASAIANSVADAALEVGSGATLWFVFVGHGAIAPDGNDGILLGIDASQSQSALSRQGLSLGALLKILDMGAQAHTLVVLDTSFDSLGPSGGPQDVFSASSSGKPSSSDSSTDVLPGTLARTISTRLDERGTVFMPVQALSPPPTLPGLDLPVFSYLLLGGMRGWADQDTDGRVLPAELADFVNNTLELVLGPQAPGLSVLGNRDTPATTFGREPAPEFPAIVVDAIRQRILDTEIALDELQERLLAKAENDWQRLQPLLRDGIGEPHLEAYLSRYNPAIVTWNHIRRWVQVPHMEQARQMLGMDQPGAPDAAPARQQARHTQLTEDLRRLSKRNAWKGVERAYNDIVALGEFGVQPSQEDHLLGAQAARALGHTSGVHDRLLAALAILPTPEIIAWLNDIEISYGKVRLEGTSGSQPRLDPWVMPFAPDQRACIQYAAGELAETGGFQGYLPWGWYHFGEYFRLLPPGDQSLEITWGKPRR